MGGVASGDLSNPDRAIEKPSAPLWSGGELAWIISRYADVRRVLRCAAVTVGDPGAELVRVAQRGGRDYANLAAILQATLLFQRDPVHRRSREAVRAFLADLAARWTASAIRRAARRVVAGLPATGLVDAVSALADALPNMVIADALGCTAEEVRWLRAAGREITAVWRPAPPLREYARLDELCREIRGAIAGYMQRPAHRASLQSGPGPHDAVAGDLAFFLSTAAVDTTAGTIAAGLDLLARKPELQPQLRDSPKSVEGFIRETLRLAGPIRRLNRRVITAPMTFDGVTIPANSGVILDIGRAHRDPAAFPLPESLDIGRHGLALLAFGGGAHYCPGVALGSAQAQIMLEEVLRRFSLRPGLARGTLFANPDLRQFAALPLQLMPAGQ